MSVRYDGARGPRSGMLPSAHLRGVAALLGLAVWVSVAGVMVDASPWKTVAMVLGAAVGLLLGGVGAGRNTALVPAAIVALAGVLLILRPLETLSAAPDAWPLGYANANGAFFAIAALAALSLGALARSGWMKAGAVALAMPFAAVPMASGAVAAAIVLGVAAVIGLLALMGRLRSTERIERGILATTASFLVVLAGTVLIAAPGGPGILHERARASVTERRVELWGDALALIRAHPWTGVGAGRFAAESPTARSDDDATRAHHGFLQFGAETGVPGFVFLLLLFLWGFLRLSRSTSPGGLRILSAVALAAVGVLASVDYVLHFPLILLVATALVGNALGPIRTEITDGTPAQPARSFTRKALKVLVLPAGSARPRRRGDVVILLYHRVGVGEREIDLPLRAFKAQMAYLAAHERVLSLDQALDDGDGGVVVSFDDGSPDFYDAVLPVLEEHRLPAILYLTTGWVRNSGPTRRGTLTWRELEDAVATGLVTVASHTHSHIDLSKLSERAAAEEMRRSKELIEDRLGTACRHFAYPWGVANAAAEGAARRLFETAALHAWRTNRRGHLDVYRLGRTPVLRSDGMFFFRAKVTGRLDGEALLYRALRRGPWGRR